MLLLAQPRNPSVPQLILTAFYAHAAFTPSPPFCWRLALDVCPAEPLGTWLAACLTPQY